MANTGLHIDLYRHRYEDVIRACLQCAVVTAACFILATIPQTDAIGLRSGGPAALVWFVLLFLFVGFMGSAFCWFSASLEKHQFMRCLTDMMDKGEEPTPEKIRQLYRHGFGNVSGKFGRSIGRAGISLGMVGLVSWALAAGLQVFLGQPGS